MRARAKLIADIASRELVAPVLTEVGELHIASHGDDPQAFDLLKRFPRLSGLTLDVPTDVLPDFSQVEFIKSNDGTPANLGILAAGWPTCWRCATPRD